MIFRMVRALDTVSDIPAASAHCDIPCKIYDPSTALIAALSVVRLMDIMAETAGGDNPQSLEAQNTISRCVVRKEEEAEKVKQEIRITWGDYFKAPQIEAFPDIHDLVHQIMMKASACKQGTARADGEALVELVNQFAEAFWKTKDIETVRKTCPYPPEMPTVYPVL
ncbi:MAG: superoxide dismutase, Ni [Rhodospirillaceae bacterium]|nr:superoxide dismutase, Ni [Rhodospirillaceae bacterium]HAA92892.1 superoxide dismutase, Ni [Rhodospirillaceae bacterium]|tara:strand:- start:350 stop:850 length:501 start_codon:yes stop_codon:yes gene_type:complete